MGWMKTNWTVDHYVLHDLPTAIRFILNKTRKKRLHWVGHSLGGLLVPPFMNTHSADALQSVVLAASPVTGVPKSLHKWMYLVEPLLRLLPIVPYKTMAKLVGLRPHWIFHGPVPKLFVTGNMDVKTLKRGASIAVDDLSSGVILQFQDWMRSKKFRSPDGKIRYFVDFNKKTRLPMLFIAGSHDPLTSVDELERVVERLATKKKSFLVFGKNYGHAEDYSHWDLILGRHAPLEVYPAIADWLKKHD
jgi:alpha-beta hydrolase superfamily lysophospholipase